MLIKSLSEGAKLSPFALLLNPVFWLAIIGWTAFVAYYGFDVGAERERLKQTELTAKALQQQIDANELILKRERELRTADNKEFIDFKKEHDHAKENVVQFVTDLRRGDSKLRIPSAVCHPAPAASAPSAPGVEQEGYAELGADDSVFLVELLARGDEAILKHATVVDLYENLRLACTAPPETETGTP